MEFLTDREGLENLRRFSWPPLNCRFDEQSATPMHSACNLCEILLHPRFGNDGSSSSVETLDRRPKGFRGVNRGYVGTHELRKHGVLDPVGEFTTQRRWSGRIQAT